MLGCLSRLQLPCREAYGFPTTRVKKWRRATWFYLIQRTCNRLNLLLHCRALEDRTHLRSPKLKNRALPFQKKKEPHSAAVERRWAATSSASLYGKKKRTVASQQQQQRWRLQWRISFCLRHTFVLSEQRWH